MSNPTAGGSASAPSIPVPPPGYAYAPAYSSGPTAHGTVAWTSAATGVAGVVLGALNVGQLTSPVDAVITSVSGLLVAIAAWHAHTVTARRAVNKRSL